VDSGYRGEVMAKFASREYKPKNVIDKVNGQYEYVASLKCLEPKYSENNYNIGDRVAQMVILPYPKVTFVEKDELSETDRGEGGYGSTGK
jgi:dUTP pyrophosphatase